jgi:predicted peroxiredoxin
MKESFMPCGIFYDLCKKIYSGFTLANLSPCMNLDIKNVIWRAFLIFQMAGRARRGQNERIPPPPPPTLQEMMAQQNEIL